MMYAEIGELATALVEARKKFGPLARNQSATVRGKNKKTGEYYNYSYKYADLPAIFDAVLPALAAAGISVVQCPQLEPEFSLDTLLVHKSGQFIRSSMPLPRGIAPQELGSHITYYRRYALAAMLGMAAEDDDDGATAQAGHASQQQRSIEVIVPPMPPDTPTVHTAEFVDAAAPEPTNQSKFELAIGALINRGATALATIGGYDDPYAEMHKRLAHTLGAHGVESVQEITVRPAQMKFYRDVEETVDSLEEKADEVALAGI